MKKISYREMMNKLDEYYGCEVLMSFRNNNYSVEYPYLAHLLVYESEDNIILQDDNDIKIAINRFSIMNTTVSNHDATSERIDLDFNNGGFSFILYHKE